MTRLEAVNRILMSMGELPVDDLENPLTEVELALKHIDMANAEVQLDGWYFNTESVSLIPDEKGNVLIPYDAVKVINLPYGFVVVSGRVYDDINKTFNINKKVKCSVVKLMDFEDIPMAFALWITLRAAKKYQNNTLTSASLANNLEREELEAMLLAKKEHRQIARPNLKGTSAGYHIQKVLRR